MVKLIDISWIADKALDIYCSELAFKYFGANELRRKSIVANKEINALFNNIFDMVVSYYKSTYDKVFIIVPCFPITRTNSMLMMTRFMCRHIDYLREHGVSFIQFHSRFEKFIDTKCKNDYVNEVSDGVYIMNASGVLFTDWTNALYDYYGKSLINDEKDGIFSNNPNFIGNFEDGLEKFTKTTEELQFKLKNILKQILD